VNDGFWDRLAARVRPTDTLKTIENPRVIARAFSAAMWVSVVQLLVTATLSSIFDETSVAWAALGLAGAFFVAWIAFVLTGSILIAFVIALVTGTIGNVYAHVALEAMPTREPSCCSASRTFRQPRCWWARKRRSSPGSPMRRRA
jgi:hypothetical protein